MGRASAIGISCSIALIPLKSLLPRRGRHGHNLVVSVQ